MRTLRTTLALVGTSALLGATAAPALAQDTAGTYPGENPSSGQTQNGRGHHGRGHKRGHHKLSDAQLTKVATALGTTLEALKAAQADVKAAVTASDARETRAEEDALLASKLGVTVEQLRAAFDSVRPAGGERGGCKKGSKDTSTDTGTYPGETAAGV